MSFHKKEIEKNCVSGQTCCRRGPHLEGHKAVSQVTVQADHLVSQLWDDVINVMENLVGSTGSPPQQLRDSLENWNISRYGHYSQFCLANELESPQGVSFLVSSGRNERVTHWKERRM